MKFPALLLLTSAYGLVGACDLGNVFGKETGRIPFTAEGHGQTTAQLGAGDVAFWTDMNIAFDGDASLVYKITLTQGGKVVGSTTCDPLGDMPTRTNYVTTDFGSRHTRRGQGKMPCGMNVPAAGPTLVEATLEWSPKPTTLTMAKSDLIIKQ